MNPRATHLLWLLERVPGVCAIETDAAGIFTHFGPGAEAFFRCPAAEALGRLHYSAFHDPEQMKACAGDPAFKAEIASKGYHDARWRVLPRAGEPFEARVALFPSPALDNAGAGGQNTGRGWVALYRRLD